MIDARGWVAWGREDGELVFNGDRVSNEDSEKVRRWIMVRGE